MLAASELLAAPDYPWLLVGQQSGPLGPLGPPLRLLSGACFSNPDLLLLSRPSIVRLPRGPHSPIQSILAIWHRIAAATRRARIRSPVSSPRQFDARSQICVEWVNAVLEVIVQCLVGSIKASQGLRNRSQKANSARAGPLDPSRQTAASSR